MPMLLLPNSFGIPLQGREAGAAFEADCLVFVATFLAGILLAASRDIWGGSEILGGPGNGSVPGNGECTRG